MPADAIEDEKTVRDVNFDDADLSESAAWGVDIEQCRFTSCRMPTTLRQATFTDVQLEVCDFANTQADDSSLIRSRVSTSRMTGLSWTKGVIRDVTIEDSKAAHADFRYTKLKTVVFQDCDLQNSDWQRAEMRNVLFHRCNLTGAQFSNAQLQHNVRFEDCVLIDIRGVAGMKGATIQGGDLLGLAASLAREVGISVEW